MCLTFSLSTDPSKMVVGEMELKKVDQSAVAGTDTVEGALPPTLPGPLGERGRNRGCLLSGIVCVNILILGSALVSGSAISAVNISTIHLQIFLILLIVLTISWMVYYTSCTVHRDHAVLYKDGHAGPIWLRGGLVLFGVCSLIMDVFKIGNYVGYLHCESAVKIVFPAVQALFILLQTYFLWFHAKDCVQVERNITRCGILLTLSTNLMVWMTVVTEESLHQTFGNTTHTRSSDGPEEKAGEVNYSCKCSHSACDVFKQAYYYLYPFIIEYSLFASAMTYVMWKNVGRQTDEHAPHHPRFSLKGVLLGPVAGVAVLVAGLVTFVVYEVDMVQEDPETRDSALMMHYVMNTVAVSLMSVAALVGCAIYKLDQRDHSAGKNPTRSLDVGLLLGASLGQLIICYYTIVCVVASGSMGPLNSLNLVTALVTGLQLCLQNGFIIEGLRREPFLDAHSGSVTFTNVHAQHQEAHTARSSMGNVSPIFVTHSPFVPSWLGLGWKRRILKEISSFLLLCNIILWIMPAFGARPQFENPIGSVFYTDEVWQVIVNIGLPFGIFYRMHSVAGLFEVFLTS